MCVGYPPDVLQDHSGTQKHHPPLSLHMRDSETKVRTGISSALSPNMVSHLILHSFIVDFLFCSCLLLEQYAAHPNMYQKTVHSTVWDLLALNFPPLSVVVCSLEHKDGAHQLLERITMFNAESILPAIAILPHPGSAVVNRVDSQKKPPLLT